MRTLPPLPLVALALPLLSLLSGCGLFADLLFNDEREFPVTAVCGALPADVTGKVQDSAGDGVLRQDLVVTGTANHPDGLAIRSILVAGIPAVQAANASNFSSWTVTVPIRNLIDLALEVNGEPDVGEAWVEVMATDSCAQVDPLIDAFPIRVDLSPETVVSELHVDFANQDDLPEGVDYLPADGSFPALLALRANADAAGALVEIEATSGVVSGPDSEGELFLGGDGSSEASACALFTPAQEGIVQITASAEDQIAALTIRVESAPSILPAGGGVEPGERLRVSVLTDGLLRECVATSDTLGAFTVTSGAADLLGSPSAGQDQNGDGNVDIDIEVDGSASAGASLDLRCEDVYRQWSLVTFVVE